MAKLPALLQLYTDGQVEVTGGYSDYTKTLEFPTNRKDLVGTEFPHKRLLGHDGRVINLEDFSNKRVLVVMLRGFAGQVCLYCSAQTKILSEMVEDFAKRDTEVVFVYPGPASSIRSFLSGVQTLGGDIDQLPGIGLDVNTKLVDQLSTHGDLSQPSSFILGRDGKIAYAYMGKDMVDRPSAAFLLDILDRLP